MNHPTGNARLFQRDGALFVEARCELCGRFGEDVNLKVDPFMLDVYDMRIEIEICSDCYERRRLEV